MQYKSADRTLESSKRTTTAPPRMGNKAVTFALRRASRRTYSTKATHHNRIVNERKKLFPYQKKRGESPTAMTLVTDRLHYIYVLQSYKHQPLLLPPQRHNLEQLYLLVRNDLMALSEPCNCLQDFLFTTCQRRGLKIIILFFLLFFSTQDTCDKRNGLWIRMANQSV